MGLYGNYCVVEPAELEAHRGDYWSWWRLYEPTDFEGRTLTTDRMWDALWYVLDPARRAAAPRAPSEPLGVAVVGARMLNPAESARYEPSATGVINQSRYLTPGEVRAAAAALAAVGDAAVLGAYDRAAMRAADVYRVGAPERLVGLVRDLRAFYGGASAKGSAVTVRVS